MAAYDGYCHICLRNFASKREDTWRTKAGDAVSWIRRGPCGDFLERHEVFYGVCYGCLRERQRKLGGRKGSGGGSGQHSSARRTGRPGTFTSRNVLLSPLAVGFSQRRVRPRFQDGRDVWESSCDVLSEPYPSRNASCSAQEEDILLVPPFAPIEVVRWHRSVSSTGSGTEDDQEDEFEDGWFTLDNRRLLCLQCAAMKRWPQHTLCVVRILQTDTPSLECALGREFRQKFTTLSAGRQLEVTSKLGGAVTVWDWRAKASAASAEDSATKAKIQKDGNAASTSLLPAASLGSRFMQHPSYRPSDPAEREGMPSWMFLVGIMILYIALRVFFPESKRLIMTAAVVGGGTWISMSVYDKYAQADEAD